MLDMITSNINSFFATHWKKSLQAIQTADHITTNKKSVKCMLNVVKFIRLQCSGSKLENLNYLYIAKAAEFCGAHFTAILYVELWCQKRSEDLNKTTSLESGYTLVDTICENEDESVGKTLQTILRSAYKAIGDDDALPGCGISYLLQPELRVEHYKESGQWNQVIQFYEMQLANGDKAAKQNLFDSLKKTGLYQIPLMCTKMDEEPQYECLWRLSQWNSGETVNNRNSSFITSDYEKFKFYSLKSLHDNDEFSFEESLKLAQLCVADNLKHTSLESSKNLYPILSQLQSLVEVEDFANCQSTENIVSLLSKWKLQQSIISKNDFQYVEPIISQRICMLNDYVWNKDLAVQDQLTNIMLEFSDYAREEGHIKAATNVITKLQFMNLNEQLQLEVQLREAQLAWLNNDKLVAKHILSKICKSTNSDPRIRAASLKLLGQYMVESYSESRQVIMKDFFFKSTETLTTLQTRTSQDCESMLDTYDKIASFADREYQQIMAHMKSDIFQKKVSNIKKSREVARNLSQKQRKTNEEKKAAHFHEKQSIIDEAEIENTKKEKDELLVYALKYYLKNLIHSDINNIKVFRVIALLIENRDNTIIEEVIKKYLPQISSYKFVPMLPQIIPHISEFSNDFFSSTINSIVEKCAREHPHHTLPLLLSLANSNKDKEYTDPKTKVIINDARVFAAKNILEKLKKDGALANLINRLNFYSEAIIELAYSPVDEDADPKKPIKIPMKLKIHKVKNFDDILCPTVTLPVSKSNTYRNIIGISHHNPTFNDVGGINHPKHIICWGTDGKPRHQLAKGKDDLRQDAVMQQVFTIMNSLLAANKQTSNLLIRTYKVVPLSMRSGILEWVVDTVPIGKYLLEAHQEHRPNDRSPSSCRQLFQKVAGKHVERKLEIYNSICKNLKPVMHHFFEKTFPQATVWYERRRAYTLSVATTSMCGYILGIGDRHVSNILLDQKTAEVVHIDFGIAFEQGRCLPTPETVPFRLTRDIVDGMGVSGVEGIFRRSCEKTMEVLRQNAQTIMTILEVLLYDPLYDWTVSSAEANKRQTENSDYELSDNSEEGTTNITAERALLRLKAKLQGTEEGNPISIEHQVGTLIQQAMDPSNLCRLYHGWQPFL